MVTYDMRTFQLEEGESVEFIDGLQTAEGQFEFTNTKKDARSIQRDYPAGSCIPIVVEVTNYDRVTKDINLTPVFEHSEKGVIGIEDLEELRLRGAVPPYHKPNLDTFYYFPGESLTRVGKFRTWENWYVHVKAEGPFRGKSGEKAPRANDRYRHYNITIQDVEPLDTVFAAFCARLGSHAMETKGKALNVSVPSVDQHVVIPKVSILDPVFERQMGSFEFEDGERYEEDGDGPNQTVSYVEAKPRHWVKRYNENTCVPVTIKAENHLPTAQDIWVNPVYEYYEDGKIGFEDLLQMESPNPESVDNLDDFTYTDTSIMGDLSFPVLGSSDSINAYAFGPYNERKGEKDIGPTNRYRHYNILLEDVPADSTALVSFCAKLSDEASETRDEHLVLMLPQNKQMLIFPRLSLKDEEDT